MINLIYHIKSQPIFQVLQFKQLLQNNYNSWNLAQICSNQLFEKHPIGYCLKATTLSSQVQQANLFNSPQYPVYYSMYTQRTQDLKLNFTYSMMNLPSFALFGLTNSISISQSIFSVKVPQILAQGALVCLKCDVNASSSDFAFVASGQNVSGLILSSNTSLTMILSKVQFRLSGVNVGGLVLDSSQIQFLVSNCNISGFVLEANISASVITFVRKAIMIQVDNVRICANVNKFGSGDNLLQIIGVFIESCDLCAKYFYAYGLCVEDLEYSELVDNKLQCQGKFIFDGEICQCPEGEQLYKNNCVNILTLVELQADKISHLENITAETDKQVQILEDTITALQNNFDCASKHGILINHECKSQIAVNSVYQCTQNINIVNFDIQQVTNYVSQVSFTDGFVFSTSQELRDAFISIFDGVYSQVKPLFQSQTVFNNIKIQLGSQSVSGGSILTGGQSLSINQVSIMSRGQTQVSVTTQLNIISNFIVKADIKNLILNMNVINGNVTLCSVSGSLSIINYVVIGSYTSQQQIALIGLEVDSSTVIVSNVHFKPVVFDVGNCSSFLFSNVNSSIISISSVAVVGTYKVIQSQIDVFYFSALISFSNFSAVTVNYLVSDLFITSPKQSSFGFVTLSSGILSFHNICFQLTIICDEIALTGIISSCSGNSSITNSQISISVLSPTISSFGIIGEQTEQFSLLNNLRVHVNISTSPNSGNYVGGIIGKNTGSIILNEIKLDQSNINAYSSAGGLVGCSTNSLNISNADVHTNVSGAGYVGGIIGYNYCNTTITDTMVAFSNVSVTDVFVGGAIGYCVESVINIQNIAIQHIKITSGSSKDCGVVVGKSDESDGGNIITVSGSSTHNYVNNVLQQECNVITNALSYNGC
ncbi:Hypothetical_protein [Hexamita inflata]|uniref:Hypothetical_protein n=1 Tax=Hexamita inflata TaxID=28002 RepID=A0AA86TS96_9EUKA|nr:Hypothetical protein HINF_LOCUS14669 [Hexamita inflata]